jgi:hypothetical protein
VNRADISTTCPELPALMAGAVAALNREGIAMGMQAISRMTGLRDQVLSLTAEHCRGLSAAGLKAARMSVLQELTLRTQAWGQLHMHIAESSSQDGLLLQIVGAHAATLLSRQSVHLLFEALDLTAEQQQRLQARRFSTDRTGDMALGHLVRTGFVDVASRIYGLRAATQSFSVQLFGGADCLLTAERAQLDELTSQCDEVLELGVAPAGALNIGAVGTGTMRHARTLVTSIEERALQVYERRANEYAVLEGAAYAPITPLN